MMKLPMLIIMSAFLLFSCQSEAPSDDIKLNNGEKWQVNAEMKPHILQGKEILDAYINDGRSDYQQLATELSEQNNNLIQSCTMSGESHDELHKWLHPHLGITKKLAEAKDKDEAELYIAQLLLSYNTYQEYFE